MTKYLTIILSIFTFSLSLGQTAVIKDKDGYTNVRSQPNANSEILYKLPEDFIFLTFYFREQTTKSDWIPVDIPKHAFSQTDSEQTMIKGYIHKSRVDYLNDHIYTGDQVIYSLVNKPFSKKDHQISYTSEGPYIETIDYLFPYGIDGFPPKTEIDSIQLSINDKSIDIPKHLTQGLFNCSTKYKVYKIKNTYYIEQWHSDGAGGYILVWAIKNNTIIQRLVFQGF